MFYQVTVHQILKDSLGLTPSSVGSPISMTRTREDQCLAGTQVQHSFKAEIISASKHREKQWLEYNTLNF